MVQAGLLTSRHKGEKPGVVDDRAIVPRVGEFGTMLAEAGLRAIPTVPAAAVDYASSFWTTLPPTSVSRKSRPMWR